MFKRIWVLATLWAVLAVLSSCTLPQEINVIPTPGSDLRDSENAPIGVTLQTVNLAQGVTDRQYQYISHEKDLLYRPITKTVTLDVGTTIWVLSGTVSNEQETGKDIVLYAQGLHGGGELVSWTLDAADVPGQVRLHVEPSRTANFTLHMYYSSESMTIRIYGTSENATSP